MLCALVFCLHVRSLQCHSGAGEPPIRQRRRCFLHKLDWREQEVTPDSWSSWIANSPSPEASTSTEWLTNTTRELNTIAFKCPNDLLYRCCLVAMETTVSNKTENQISKKIFFPSYVSRAPLLLSLPLAPSQAQLLFKYSLHYKI